MEGERIKARSWNMEEWYVQNRGWVKLPPVSAEVSIEPDVAEASQADTWRVRYRVGEDELKPGAHIALEIPLSWKLDLGRSYPAGVKNVMRFGDGNPGYGAFISVEVSREDVRLDVLVSYCSRFNIIDAAIVEGTLRNGDTLEIIMGHPEGSKLRCQKHAQKAILAMGADLSGDGTYRMVEPQPTVRVIGAHAQALKVIAPATVERGRPFEIQIMVVDGYNANPASNYGGSVELDCSMEGSRIPESYAFQSSPRAIARVSDCALYGEGAAYITAVDRKRGLIGRSNPIVSRKRPEYSIYFGEIHAQFYDSIGTGDIDEYYQWGRDVERLDFCATANHYGGRRDVTPDVWRTVVDGSNKYYEPGKFVTFVSFEWGGGAFGHKNVYYRGDDGPFLFGRDPAYNTPEKLWRALEGRDALTIPHHPKYCSVTDWRFRNDEMQRLVEICSVWGISEEGGSHSVQRALAMGHRLGFTGGTDNHYGQPGHGTFGVNEGKGLTAVYSKELTREAIWDALYSRHCYATTGERIVLDFEIDGHRMGAEVGAKGGELPRRRRIRSRVFGTWDIKSVEIMRNDRVVYRQPGDGWSAELEWEDDEGLEDIAIKPSFPEDPSFVFYYCRVIQANREMAWSSPIWFLL